VAEGTSGRVLRKCRHPSCRAVTIAEHLPRASSATASSSVTCGHGPPRDIVLKDRYWRLWAYTDTLEPLWQLGCERATTPMHTTSTATPGRAGRPATRSSTTTAASSGATTRPSRITRTGGDRTVPADQPPRCCGQPATRACCSRPAAQDPAPASARARAESLDGGLPAGAPGLETVTINFWGNQGMSTLRCRG